MSCPQVEVEEGILEGYVCENGVETGKSFFSFQGIPYAKPPLGDLRFKAPQPAESWTGVKEVKEDGSPCYAKNMMTDDTSGSEDCLYLNIYTPKLPTKQGETLSYDLKPVMLFIHGGAFTCGSNSKNFYGPDYLIREDVVIISINYRIGFLGFLHLKDPSLGVPGNAGLKDMVMALRWVKNNIKNFNGDPDNVTIFGESAGAASVHLLVLSPMAKGLFHKAIIQSGCALNPWVECGNISPAIAKALGIEENDETTLLRKLKEMKVEELHRIQESFPDIWDVSMKRMAGYVVEMPNQEEEAFLTEHPLKILESGEYNHVPIIMGYTTREGMLIHFTHKKTFKEYTPDIESVVPYYLGLEKNSASSKTLSRKIVEYYFGDQDTGEADIDIAYKLWSDNFFIRDIYSSITLHAKTSSLPIYVYEMAIETSLNILKKMFEITTPGVSHGDDLFYIFKTLLNGEIEPDSPEDIAVRRFCRLWANFARHGDPNSATEDPLLQVSWKEFNPEDENYLEIDQELSVRIDPVKERMQFWEEIEQNRVGDMCSEMGIEIFSV